MTTAIPRTVEVFNADYRSFAQVSWMDAVRLLLRNAAHVIETHSPVVHIHSPSLVVELPSAVVLKQYAHRPYRKFDASLATRERVLLRDKKRCGYCGDTAETVDHVLPRSRGGTDSWFNLISACGPCNGRKANRTPQEANMPLLWEPYLPSEKDTFFTPSDA